MTLKELDSLSEKYKIPVISVDFLNHSYHTVQSKQLDNSRYLICTLTENGIPRGVKPDEIARLRLEKPDKTYVYNECETIEDGRILVTLTEQILAVKGKAQCDIQLTSKSGIIYSTKNFIINIDSTPYPLDAIESSDEFNALNDIIAREGERIKIVEELEQTVTENEAVRNENESNRISSENTRKTNETARQNQEAARQNQETTRQNQEAVRQANENIRIANENSRKTNETVRQTNETNRQNNTAAAISNAEKATKKANDAADDLQNKLNQHHFVLTEDKDVAGGVPSLDTNRKVPVNELYEATVSSKGITQLTNSVSSTSTTTAATPNSVKTVNDAVNTEKNRAITAENNLSSKIDTAIAGIKSGDAYISVNQSENNVTITHKDVARNNTTSTSKPTYGGTFTAVKSVSSDSKGHITGVDTETITLPNAYTHPSATAYSSGLYKITTNNLGHVTSAVAVTKGDITGLGIPANNIDTHYTTHLITGTSSSATANAAATNGNVWLNVLDNTTVRNAHNIVGSGAVSVTSDANGKITINGTNTTYTTGTASTSGLTKLYTGTGTATDGTMTQAAIKSALDGKAASNHNHNGTYLPLSGGTMTGTITSSKVSTTFLAGNQGAVIIHSTAAAGSYTMLAKMNSTNGYFTHGTYQGYYLLQYTAKSTVDAGTNNVTKSVVLLNEAGNSDFPGTVSASSFSGSLNGNASSATKVIGTSTDPTTATTYYPTFVTGGSTTEAKDIRQNGDFRVVIQKDRNIGKVRLELGNSAVGGASEDYKKGILRLYSDYANYVDLVCGNSSNGTAATIILPATSGTLALTNHTHNNMTAATASADGKAGFVPAPPAGSQDKFLCGDGTWKTAAQSKISKIIYVSYESNNGYNRVYGSFSTDDIGKTGLFNVQLTHGYTGLTYAELIILIQSLPTGLIIKIANILSGLSSFSVSSATEGKGYYSLSNDKKSMTLGFLTSDSLLQNTTRIYVIEL